MGQGLPHQRKLFPPSSTLFTNSSLLLHKVIHSWFFNRRCPSCSAKQLLVVITADLKIALSRTATRQRSLTGYAKYQR